MFCLLFYKDLIIILEKNLLSRRVHILHCSNDLPYLCIHFWSTNIDLLDLILLLCNDARFMFVSEWISSCHRDTSSMLLNPNNINRIFFDTLGSESAYFPPCFIYFFLYIFFLFFFPSLLKEKKKLANDILESFISVLNWLLRRILRSTFFFLFLPKHALNGSRFFFHSFSFSLSHSIFLQFFFFSFYIEEREKSAIRTITP
jgi:hypothetical protein